MFALIEYAVLAALWGTTLLLVPSALRAKRRLLFWFMLAFAVTISLIADGPYAFVDGLLGGVDTTYFIFHATAIICVALFDSLIQTAVSKAGLTSIRKRFALWGATGLILLQAGLFFTNDWDINNIQFVGPGDWSQLVYSFTTWIALIVLAVSTIVACLTDFKRQSDTSLKTALVMISAGCALVSLYVVIQMGVAINRATGGTTVNATVDFLSVACPLLAPVLLSVGLGLRLLIGASRNLSDAGRSRRLLWKVTPLWERLLADRPELSIEAPMSRVALYFRGSHAVHLHRRYVEVRDCLLLHPDQALSAREAKLIQRIEEHIRQASDASRWTTNDSRTDEHQDA
ncbi:hypothetical protein E3O42_16280 [Cryobacterium adonitolivorans]|uniref:DUF6545 domain-containing protein n=1 Tax=Cryobacterium adonitolivorans TaxID=1259189 RepID=A0A4R8W211_9MICO|nr:DUF6545 domain-containing protein [Cryobacterium adonitolivorans]TFB97494.1 hypothetical protein E3O42_16280 [Cryobacterium adonitolivorans]